MTVARSQASTATCESALAATLAGAGEITSGTLKGVDNNAVCVSLESQAALIERERLRDDSDITNEVYEGTPVREMLDEGYLTKEQYEHRTGRFLV